MLKNLASMATLNLFKAGVQFAISTLMAFFVLPAKYGLVTFSLPIIQFIALISDLGLASAIIRQPDLTSREAGGALSFSVLVGFIAMVLLIALARPIEISAHLPGVALVLSALALAVFATIAAGVPRAMLERDLRYQFIAKVEGAAVVGAMLICFAMVGLGMGIWGLVTFHVVLQSARAVAFLSATRGLYTHNRAWREVREVITFGGWVLATNLVNFASRNAQSILIGAFLGAAAVGLYGLAYQFMLLPLMALAWPASGVLLATLSRHTPGTARDFEKPVLAVSQVTALAAFPVMCYLTFGLDFPVRAYLNPHWRDMLPLVVVLAPLGALQALAAYNGSVLIARGRSKMQFHVNLIGSSVLLLGFICSLGFGLRAFAATYLVVGTLVAVGQISVKLWGAKVAVSHYLQALALPTLATGAALAAVSVVGTHASDLLGWLKISLAYAGVVAVIYALGRKSIIGAVRLLLAR